MAWELDAATSPGPERAVIDMDRADGSFHEVELLHRSGQALDIRARLAAAPRNGVGVLVETTDGSVARFTHDRFGGVMVAHGGTVRHIADDQPLVATVGAATWTLLGATGSQPTAIQAVLDGATGRSAERPAIAPLRNPIADAYRAVVNDLVRSRDRTRAR